MRHVRSIPESYPSYPRWVLHTPVGTVGSTDLFCGFAHVPSVPSVVPSTCTVGTVDSTDGTCAKPSGGTKGNSHIV